MLNHNNDYYLYYTSIAITIIIINIHYIVYILQYYSKMLYANVYVNTNTSDNTNVSHHYFIYYLSYITITYFFIKGLPVSSSSEILLEY